MAETGNHSYCDFPSEHWTRIRTNNVIERLNREILRIYFSQQMLFRHQLVYDHELYHVPVQFPSPQRFSSLSSILTAK